MNVATQPEKVASLHGGLRQYFFVYLEVMQYKTGLIRRSKFNTHHLTSAVVVLDFQCPPFDIYIGLLRLALKFIYADGILTETRHVGCIMACSAHVCSFCEGLVHKQVQGTFVAIRMYGFFACCHHTCAMINGFGSFCVQDLHELQGELHAI